MTIQGEKTTAASWLVKLASAVLLTLGAFGVALYSVTGLQADNSGQTPGVMELVDLDLTDQHGVRLTKSLLKDKLVMMNFFFTGCSGACPMQTAVLRDVQQLSLIHI